MITPDITISPAQVRLLELSTKHDPFDGLTLLELLQEIADTESHE